MDAFTSNKEAMVELITRFPAQDVATMRCPKNTRKQVMPGYPGKYPWRPSLESASVLVRRFPAIDPIDIAFGFHPPHRRIEVPAEV